MSDKPRTFNFNFREEFAPKVEAGEKVQTIRLNRRDGRNPRPGDRVQLFSGLRTARTRRIGAGQVTACLRVYIELGEASTHVTRIDGVNLSADEAESFAKIDGFESAKQMREFFRKQYEPMRELEGFCVRWTLDRKARAC
jgi:hypothetical protein